MSPKKRQKQPNRRPVPAGKPPAAGKVPVTPIKNPAKPGFQMTSNMKFTAALVAIVLAIVGTIWWSNRDTGPASNVIAEQLVRANSHKLSTAADGQVTVVEFLDFECPSCGAAYPGVEKLRAEYGDRISYVVRLYPLPSHRNGLPAAKAAQAAANQGKFEDMYKKLFDTQGTWGGQEADQTATFEGFAKDLGLDVEKYKTDVAAQATADFINAEVADGKAVKVTGTPTFFVNGQKFNGNPTYERLKSAIDEAFAA